MSELDFSKFCTLGGVIVVGNTSWTTLGVGTVDIAISVTLGGGCLFIVALTGLGCCVARLRICANWIYAFVTGVPYVNVGSVGRACCNICTKSVAACRR